jgi:hypothetical protein
MKATKSESRIKLFVGCAPNGEDAESQMVLEYTARKNSSLPIDITWMKHNKDPDSIWGGWNSQTWATPFSGFRWAIPEACDFKGQAIYMDSDMIILGDLAELWNEPFNQQAPIIMMKGGWRTCVAKWDCLTAKHVLPKVKEMKPEPYAHQMLFEELKKYPRLQQTFDRQWNNFDGENDSFGDIKILHYTDMSTQPHLKYAFSRLKSEGRSHWFDGTIREHRRQGVQLLFDSMYFEALDSGMSPQDYYSLDSSKWIGYNKESQKGYNASNGFDITKGE